MPISNESAYKSEKVTALAILKRSAESVSLSLLSSKLVDLPQRTMRRWLMAWVGLTRNLYRSPVEQIESSRAQMLLRNTSKKIATLPHADVLLLRLQNEYETLMKKINEFSAAKLHWMEVKKNSVLENYDIEVLKNKVERLKINFLEQKKIG